jgi:hypothetical protein
MLYVFHLYVAKVDMLLNVDLVLYVAKVDMLLNVDLVSTCMHIHGRAPHKRSKGRSSMRRHRCGWSSPSCTARAARNKAEHGWCPPACSGAQQGMKQNLQQRNGLTSKTMWPCGGGRASAQLQPHAGQARHAAVATACSQTHQTCRVDTTYRASAGVLTGASVRTSGR